MKRLLFVLFAAALVVPAAFAKGPSTASISGPGLGKTITLAGMGDASDLTQNTGFFPAVFGQSPDPMLPGKPTGKLGNLGGALTVQSNSLLSVCQPDALKTALVAAQAWAKTYTNKSNLACGAPKTCSGTQNTVCQ